MRQEFILRRESKTTKLLKIWCRSSGRPKLHKIKIHPSRSFQSKIHLQSTNPLQKINWLTIWLLPLLRWMICHFFVYRRPRFSRLQWSIRSLYHSEPRHLDLVQLTVVAYTVGRCNDLEPPKSPSDDPITRGHNIGLHHYARFVIQRWRKKMRLVQWKLMNSKCYIRSSPNFLFDRVYLLSFPYFEF